MKLLLQELIGYLDDQTQEVLRLRYGLNDQDPQTLEQVGKKLDLTRERVRQIQMKGVKQLKEIFSKEDVCKSEIFGSGSIFH